MNITDKKFNGKVYKEYTFAVSKRDADLICASIRANGHLARSVKAKNGYTIYARKG